MSDESKQSLTNSKKKDSVTTNHIDIGALLVEARKNLNLSITDIATQLNLSKLIINQLENNQFSGNLPLAFVRGYVISYATKVGLDITMIKQAFDKQMGKEIVSLKRVESLSVFEKNRYNFNSNNISFKIISLLIILVIIFFAGRAGWNKYNVINVSDSVQLETTDENLTSKEAILDINTISEDSELNQNEGIDTSNINTLNLDIVNVSEKLISSIDDDEKLALDNIITSSESNKSQDNITTDFFASLEDIILNFSADCWVQIIDASGNELAFGIKKPGKVMTLQGVPPISIILGDPSVVDLSFKGNTIELSQYRAKRRVEITLH